MAARVVYDGSSDGVTLGGGATALIGFYGSAAVQAAAVTSVTTTGATSTTNAFGYTTAAQADAIVASLNALIVANRGMGIIAT